MPSRPRWDTLNVQVGERALSGSERLAALFRWLRHEAPVETVILDATGRQSSDPLTVDWGTFPLQEALEAASSAKK